MSDDATALERHQRAQQAFAGVLANVKSDQLGDATPCPDWKVRDLLGHVIGGNQRTAQSEAQLPEDFDMFVDAFAASAEAAQDAFASPDGMTKTYDVGIGPIPGSRFIVLRTTDVLTHAWDLATATGQNTDIDSALAIEMLALSQKFMRPEFRGEGMPFAAEQPCDDDAVAADRLAAFLGRPVS
ncbi:MAG: TIGR03086 family protein [Acidimicrobiia bacterium]|nr:TIGR03086 family protein [Acidimicrobiia bacterium]